MHNDISFIYKVAIGYNKFINKIKNDKTPNSIINKYTCKKLN